MGTVVSKSDFTILRSVNTPDFAPANWVINPAALSTLVGSGTDADPEVPKRYWIVDPPTSQNLREMTTPEKDAVDADAGVLVSVRTTKKLSLSNQTSAFINSRYSQQTRDAFAELRSTVSGEQQTLLNQYYSWYASVYDAHNAVMAQVDAASTVPAVLTLFVDYGPLASSDPELSVGTILSAAPGFVIGEGPSVIDLNISTTTSSNFLDKVVISSQDLTAGTYRFITSYGWNADTTSQDFEARVQENDGGGWYTIGQDHTQEAQDSGGSFGFTGSGQKYYTTRIFERDLTSGSYSWRLQYRSAGGFYEVSMWEAYLKVERV